MFVANDNYILRNINGYYLLLSSRKCSDGKWLYEINETGAVIWTLSQQEIDKDMLIDKLQMHYSYTFSIDEIQQIEKYIQLLINESLLEERK